MFVKKAEEMVGLGGSTRSKKMGKQPEVRFQTELGSRK